MTLTATIGGASSDTYATIAEYVAYAVSMGWTLADGTAANEVNLRRSRAYLDRAYEWHGIKTDETQALQWPRITSLYVDGYSVSSETIPQRIKDAQCEMAYLIQGGADPFETVTGGAVRREKVKAGPVESETEYAGTRELARYMAIEGLVRPYMIGGSRMVRG